MEMVRFEKMEMATVPVLVKETVLVTVKDNMLNYEKTKGILGKSHKKVVPL